MTNSEGIRIALDFFDDGRFWSGWASAESGIRSAIVSKPGFPSLNLDFTVAREDVVNAGLSRKVTCGFLLPKGLEVKLGDFVKIEVEDKLGNSFQWSFVAGDLEAVKKIFTEVEFARNDMSVCELSSEKIICENSTAVALKKLLIRLRRGKRGFGDRYVFKPFDYEYMQNDFKILESIVRQFSMAVRSILSTRYLFSINDTWSDYSTGEAKAISNLVGSFMMWERTFQTFVSQTTSDRLSKDLPGQSMYWGGMATHQLSIDDSMDVFLLRIKEQLEGSDLWFHFHLIYLCFSEPTSAHGRLISLSTDFSKTWDMHKEFYLNKIHALSTC